MGAEQKLSDGEPPKIEFESEEDQAARQFMELAPTDSSATNKSNTT